MTKNKTILKIILSILIICILIVYDNVSSKIVFPGGTYVRKGGSFKHAPTGDCYYIEDGQVYFTLYDEVQNITDYCSSETYFVDQVRIEDYRQTIVIGGNPNGIGDDGIKILKEFGFIGGKELEPGEPYRGPNKDRLKGGGHYVLSGASFESDIKPIWLHKASQDLDINFPFQ